jgi:hypothetical protein
VTKRSHIRLLISIFNGNLLLKKTTQRFGKWLHHYNSLTGESIPFRPRWSTILLQNNTNNSRISIDFSKIRPLLSDMEIQQYRSVSVVYQTSWLTGFLEAEGSFSAVQRYKRPTAKRKTLEMRFLLDQSNELDILVHIRDLLGDIGCIWIRKKTEKGIHYRYDVGNWEALQVLIGYLSRHPLRTKKKIVYNRWKRCLSFIEDIKHTGEFQSEKTQQKITRLVQEIKKAFKEQERLKQDKETFLDQVEDRVHDPLKDGF